MGSQHSGVVNGKAGVNIPCRNRPGDFPGDFRPGDFPGEIGEAAPTSANCASSTACSNMPMSSRLIGGGAKACGAIGAITGAVTSGAIAIRPRDLLDLLFFDFAGDAAFDLVSAASASSRDSFSLCID